MTNNIDPLFSPKKNKPTKQVVAYSIDNELINNINEISKKAHLSKSVVVNRILDSYFKNHPKK